MSERERKVLADIRRDTERYMAERKRRDMGKGKELQKGLEDYYG